MALSAVDGNPKRPILKLPGACAPPGAMAHLPCPVNVAILRLRQKVGAVVDAKRGVGAVGGLWIWGDGWPGADLGSRNELGEGQVDQVGLDDYRPTPVAERWCRRSARPQ